MMWRIGIVTVSDSGSEGKREDESGPLLQRLAEETGGEAVSNIIIPDDFATIKDTLTTFADENKCDLILTTGGTGLAERDVTPEATMEVIDKEVPGIPEAMRMSSFSTTKFSILSRSVSGIRGTTLIINLPGSPKAVQDCFSTIKEILPHALQLLQGRTEH